MSRSRDLLALNRIPEFADWARGRGFEKAKTAGDCEVLRLQRPGQPPLIFYARATARCHATAYGDGLRLVRQWLRERGRKPREAKHRNGRLT